VLLRAVLKLFSVHWKRSIATFVQNAQKKKKSKKPTAMADTVWLMHHQLPPRQRRVARRWPQQARLEMVALGVRVM